jgi:glycosyltransferase involved in cell wall biosynthesis
MSKQKLRIVFIIPSLIKGGAERLTFDTASAIARRDDAEVMLIHIREGNSFSILNPDLPVQFIPAKVTPSIKGEWLRETDLLFKKITEFKPHVIHSHLFEAEIVSRDYLYHDAAYFTHLHDNMPQFSRFRLFNGFNKRQLTNWYERRWMIDRYRKCRNAFIAISRDTEDYFRTNLPSDLQEIILLNNAIDYSRFFRASPPPLDSKVVTMVSTGSLVDKKNQIFLVDVVASLNKKGKRVRLHLLGDGPNRSKIESAIISAGLVDQIFLEGNVDLVEKYLHQVNFYVHPATYEPFGLVILEAMASGLACIVLDGKGNRDIHLEGKNGFMIPEQNAEAFADAIIRLHNDPSRYDEIGRFSSGYAASYDINAYVGRLMEIYRQRIEELNLSE